MNISAKLKVSASKSATSPSCRTLAVTLTHIIEKQTMKKYLIVILLSLLTISCKNQTEPFESFEISYTDGWTYNHTILVQKNGDFIFCKSFKNTLKGKLPIEDMNILNYELYKIEKQNIKSDSLDCIDCPKISLKVERNETTYKVIQKNKINSLIFHFETVIDKMVKNSNAQIIDKHYNFETYIDINPPFKR
jgi:hypothetical protein